MCDVSDDNMQETKALAQAKGEGRVLSSFVMFRMRALFKTFSDMSQEFDTDHINILFNNANCRWRCFCKHGPHRMGSML